MGDTAVFYLFYLIYIGMCIIVYIYIYIYIYIYDSAGEEGAALGESVWGCF